MALESKTAEQKLQKMEDSRRKNEKMAKQVEKVWPEQFIILQKNIITLIQSNLSYLDFFCRYFYYSVWGLAFVVLFVINIYLFHLQTVTTFAINWSTCKEAAIRTHSICSAFHETMMFRFLNFQTYLWQMLMMMHSDLRTCVNSLLILI